MQIVLDKAVDSSSVQQKLQSFLQSKWFADAEVAVNTDTNDNQSTILLKLPTDQQDSVSKLSQEIKNELIKNNTITSDAQILESSIIGASVWDYVKKSALWAIGGGLVLIMLYMMIAFGTIRKFIPPFILGAVTIATMIFDLSSMAWAYGLLMSINKTVQVDIIFIIALLTTMAYSINDTIVIFDRVRENLQNQEGSLKNKKQLLWKIFEDSVWQTMRRSLGTSISLLLIILAMYVFGSGLMQSFAFTVGIGILSGTYSSIFVAAPLAYLLTGRYFTEKEKLH
jgi:SecD/SecF fusion protein